MRTVTQVSFVLLLAIFTGVTPTFAQSAEPATSLLAGAGAVNFDLSGTGTTPAFSVRVSQPLGANLVVEGSLLVAKPEQQFGDSTLIVTEAQLQYHWRLDRFSPYVGAGIGAARVSSDFANTDWDPTISFAGGSRVHLTERIGLFGEFRLRGVEWDFVGTTTDVIGGIVVRLGR